MHCQTVLYTLKDWFTIIHPLQLCWLSHNAICSYQNKCMIFFLPTSLSSPSLKSWIPGFRKIWQHITGKDYRQMVVFLTDACMDLALSNQHQCVLLWDPTLASTGLPSSSWLWVLQLFSGYQGSAIKSTVGMDMREVYKYISEPIYKQSHVNYPAESCSLFCNTDLPKINQGVGGILDFLLYSPWNFHLPIPTDVLFFHSKNQVS